MLELFEQVMDYYSILMFIYFFIANIFYIILIFMSWGRLTEFVNIIKADISSVGAYASPISIVVPAYNEQETIIENIQSLLKIDYPEFEVVVVNDGSKDETLTKVVSYFGLRKNDVHVDIKINCNEIRAVYSSFKIPNLLVVDKSNGGKADALNAGINVSKYPLFCAIDADCVVEKDALLHIVKPFLKYKETVCVGGFVRIANGCDIKEGKLITARIPKKLIEKFQIIEYFRAFLTSRIGWQKLNALLIISGAFGLFKKSAVIEVGGYKKTIGEDMELTLRMHEYFIKNKKKYRIDFASDAVCWTQAPEKIKGLRTQRIRWHRGLTDSIIKHKHMLLNPKYGYVGMLSMPYFFFIELLGPVFEVIGYILMIIGLFLGILSPMVIYVFLMAYLFGILFSFSAILFEEISYKRYSRLREIVHLFGISLLEQFIYRQLTVFWRVQSFFNYKKGSKQWGTIERKSFLGGGK